MNRKVGYDVLIKTELHPRRSYNGYVVTSNMLNYRGKIAKITDIIRIGSDRYKLDIDNGFHIWTSLMFEL